jgi:hypothetical protein
MLAVIATLLANLFLQMGLARLGSAGVSWKSFSARAAAVALAIFVLRLVVYATVAYWVLLQCHVFKTFGAVLSIVLFGGFIAELARLLLMTVVAVYRVLNKIPLTAESRLRTDATVFLNKAITSGRVYNFMSSLDGLTICFILVVAVGFSATVGRARWSQSLLAASTPWTAWTLIKLAIGDGKFRFLAGF